jgi:hypothetical protein
VKGELANSAVATGCNASPTRSFFREIEIGLHRAGAEHHVEAQVADLGHVVRHDAIASLGHHRRFGARPFRTHADAEKPDAERRRHLAQLHKVRDQFGRGLMHGFDRRARKFELPAGLERDRAAAGNVEQADDRLALHDRLPAQEIAHPLQHRANAALSGIGHRLVPGEREGQFLVLGADAETLGRLAALLEPMHELVARLDRRQVDLVACHSGGCSGGGGTIPSDRRIANRPCHAAPIGESPPRAKS